MNGWRKADDATVPSVDLEIAGTKEKDSEPTSKARQPERSGLSEAKNLLFLRLKKTSFGDRLRRSRCAGYGGWMHRLAGGFQQISELRKCLRTV
jgi:hypothetical protein